MSTTSESKRNKSRGYKHIKNGEHITLPYQTAHGTKGGSMIFRCCDCGLTHNFVIIPLKTRVRVYMWRDERKTAAARRERRKRDVREQNK